MSDLSFDLAGATVVRVAWPPRGFRLWFDGKAANGLSVAGACLTFEAVANQFPLRMFLSERRFITKRSVRQRGGRPLAFTANQCKAYPLKLPAKLTKLRSSGMRRASYGDRAFTDFHGDPPAVGAGRHLYDFALGEKRFKGRKPFPIICASVNLLHADGEPICGKPALPWRTWPRTDYERLGLYFAESILMGDISKALGFCDKSLRKQHGKRGFSKWIGDWKGAAGELGPLRQYLAIEVTDGPEEVWERVSRGEQVGAAESMLAIVTASFTGRRESKTFYVVEEAKELRIARLC